jgi:YD repeat-containing protein
MNLNVDADEEHSLNAMWCASRIARSYPSSGMGYANPHAVTQIANGLSTTTYAYDNNGNLIQKTTDGVSSTYQWDYANRLVALGFNNATTSYAYGAFGNRVSRTTGTTTFRYPNKFFSVASSTGTEAKYATTTDYVFVGTSLLATMDQKVVSGTATGTAVTRYNHTDNLGSTNVTSDSTMKQSEQLDHRATASPDSHRFASYMVSDRDSDC